MVSRDEALEWAEGQYDAFAERRRLETETEARYVEDLRTSAKMLETRRKKQPTKNKKPAKSRNKGGGKGSGKGDKS